MSTYFPSVSLFFFSLSRKRKKGLKKTWNRKRILNWVVCSTFHPSRRAINRRANTVGTFLINKSLRKINIGREFAGSWYRVLERERTNERTNGSEKEMVKTITAEKIKRAGTTRSGGREGRRNGSGSRRKSRQPERRQKDELEWEAEGGVVRAEYIYVCIFAENEASERACDALLKVENGRELSR